MNNDEPTIKPKPVRGPNGRFMSTKKTTLAQPEPTKDEPIIPSGTLADDTQTAELLPTALIFFDDLTYYGEHIRRTYKNNQWFFVIEDLFPLASITDPVKIIDLYKNTPFYKNALDTDVFEVSIPKTNVGLSAITLGNEAAVLECVQLLRKFDHLFPGRFPEWIHTTSEIDYEEACLARAQSAHAAEN